MAYHVAMSRNDRLPDERNRKLAILAAFAMNERRAEDVLVLDVRSLADYADYFVIGSTDSLARLRGVVRRVDQVMAKNGAVRLNRTERDSGWSLADYGDILVHVFEREARNFYRLEELWGDAPRVKWRDQLPKSGEKN
jgi:ribosome-associated protein